MENLALSYKLSLCYIFGFSNDWFIICFAVHLNFRLFVGLLGLMMTILYNSYTTTLISDSTVIKMKPIPNSFEDLARDSGRDLVIGRTMLRKSILVKKKKHYLSSAKDWYSFIRIIVTCSQKAELGSLKILGNQLRRNPNMTISSKKEIVPNVLKGKVYAGVTKISAFSYLSSLQQNIRRNLT